MPINSCFGPERKQTIFSLYSLEAGPHCKMLDHQRLAGDRNECCGRELREEFYQFFYEPKAKAGYSTLFPRETGSFFVGHHCAKEFFALIKAENPDFKEPELFNPLRLLRQGRGHGGRDGDGGGGGPRVARTPLNDQVMTVIQLLAVVSREPLDLGLFAALRWIRENPAQDTLDWAVRAVNDAVRRHPDLDGLTLREAIERERARGQEEWKEFDFRLVERILRDDGQQSHIDPTAELPPAGEPATVIRVGARVTRVELAVGTAAMFNDCPGLADIGEPALGDLLSVRVRAHPDGPIVARIYAREERGVAGEVRYVDGAGYSFFRPDGDDGDVFVPPHAHRQAGHPAVGDRIMARIRPTERRPEATWARAID